MSFLPQFQTIATALQTLEAQVTSAGELSPLLEMWFEGEKFDLSQGVLFFEFTETIRGVASLRMELQTPVCDQWDKIVKTGGDRLAVLRWGYIDSVGPRWSRFKFVLLDDVRIRYYADHIRVFVEGVDGGFVLSERLHECSFVNKRISEMVAYLADKNGFRKTFIQPTVGQYTFYQGLMPDAQFIQQTLLPCAKDGTGRSDFTFYFQDGETLVFKPPKLVGDAADARVVRYDLTSFQQGSVPHFEIHARRYYTGHERSYSLQARGFDRESKTSLVEVANDSTVPRAARLARVQPKTPELPARAVLTTESSRGRVESFASGVWSEKGRALYQATVPVVPTVDVEAGAVVNLTMANEDHYARGLWLAHSVTWRMNSKGFGTMLGLERREQEG